VTESSIWSSKKVRKRLNFLELERKKGVEQRLPERSSAAARIEHGVAACKEPNHELWYHVVNEQLVFTVGQRPVHVHVVQYAGNTPHTLEIYSKGLYTSLTLRMIFYIIIYQLITLAKAFCPSGRCV
jgi:hypothetical protein